MSEQVVRAWADAEWGEPVSVARLSRMRLRYRVRGRRIDGEQRDSGLEVATDHVGSELVEIALSPGGWLVNLLHDAVVLLFLGLLAFFGWLGKVLSFGLWRSRVLAVRGEPGSHAVAFADAIREWPEVWVVWSSERVAAVWTQGPGCQVRWQESGPGVPRFGPDALRWVDGSAVLASRRVFGV